MLFIIVHQAYELWFKQILHELDRIQADFGGDVVEDEYLGRIVHGLDRIIEILKLLIQQLDVLETMTPLDFLDFRDLLFPASGFQSVQFRLIEIRLGLARAARLNYAGKPFDDTLVGGRQVAHRRRRARPKLIDQLDRWLARTPFVHRRDYDFPLAYRDAVERMLDDDAARVRAQPGDRARSSARRRPGGSKPRSREFQAIFAADVGPSPWRMSRAAVQAALFIIVYRDRPVLQLPFRLLAALMDVDETLDAVALPPRAHGAADDRREDRHRRLRPAMTICARPPTGTASSPTCSGSRPTSFRARDCRSCRASSRTRWATATRQPGRDDARSARHFSEFPRRRPGAHPSRRAQPSFLAGRGLRRRIAGRSPTPRGLPTTSGRRSSAS